MPIAGSRLTIESVLGKVACSHCSYSGPPKYWDGALHGLSIATLECPGCGNAARVIEGEECAIPPFGSCLTKSRTLFHEHTFSHSALRFLSRHEARDRF